MKMINGNFDWRCFYVDDFSPYFFKVVSDVNIVIW